MTHTHLATLIPIETGWSEVYAVADKVYQDPYILYGIANKGVIRVVNNTDYSHIYVKPEYRGQGICRAMKQTVWKIYPDLVFRNIETHETYRNN